MIRTALATAVIAASAGAALLAGAGTALAPEPLMLTQTLANNNGASAAGFYLNSSVEGVAVRWPSSWTPNTSLVAGTPCSTTALLPWQQATKSIWATGNYRKCM